MPPCRHPGCPELQVMGGRGYCKQHCLAVWREDGKERKGKYEHRYDKRYQRRREWVLKHNPLCVVCKAEGRLTAATVTHHIIHLADGGDNSAANLEPLCAYHHAMRHRKTC